MLQNLIKFYSIKDNVYTDNSQNPIFGPNLFPQPQSSVSNGTVDFSNLTTPQKSSWLPLKQARLPLYWASH